MVFPFLFAHDSMVRARRRCVHSAPAGPRMHSAHRLFPARPRTHSPHRLFPARPRTHSGRRLVPHRIFVTALFSALFFAGGLAWEVSAGPAVEFSRASYDVHEDPHEDLRKTPHENPRQNPYKEPLQDLREEPLEDLRQNPCTSDNPGARVEPVASPVPEGSMAEFAVTVCPAPSSDLTVTLETRQGLFADWIPEALLGFQTVTVGTSGMATFSIPTKDNNVWDGGARGVILAVFSGVGYELGSPLSTTVEITDDEPVPSSPRVLLSEARSVKEPAPTLFTVEARPAPAAALTVNLTVEETGLGDFVPPSGEGAQTVTIPAASGSTTYAVFPQGNQMDEPDGEVQVTLQPGPGYTLGPARNLSLRANILDGESTTITLSTTANATMTEGESRTFTVALGRRLVEGENLTVVLALRGRALDNDYLLSAPSTPGVTFTPPIELEFVGPLASREATVTVEALSDREIEMDETIVIRIGSIRGDFGGGGTAWEGQITFTLEDVPPTRRVTLNTAPDFALGITEGEFVPYQLYIESFLPRDTDVRVNVSEQEGSDFLDASEEGVRIIRIPANAFDQTFFVETTERAGIQAAGAFTVTVERGDGYTPHDPASFTVPVRDLSDTTPWVGFSTLSSAEEETFGTALATVQISPSFDNPATLTYSVSGTATEGADYRIANSGSVPVPADQSFVDIPIEITNDMDAEADETVVLTLMDGEGYALGPGVNVYTLTIFASDGGSNEPVASESLGDEIPDAFALEQNYPNPFNPLTTIEFALARSQHVRLAVYDLLGQEVRVLLDGVRPAARHRVSFDASDLASGAYLYVLRTEQNTTARTMTLLK